MNNSYILYAEDDEDDIAFMKEFLLATDKTRAVVNVPDGFSVIDHLQHVKKGETYPDLIILDIKLPRLSGLETLQLLKSDDIYCLIPVVVLSSRVDKEDDAFCNRMGVDIFTKPAHYDHWRILMEKIYSYTS